MLKYLKKSFTFSLLIYPSLLLANTDNSIPQLCVELFSEVDTLIKEAEQKPGVHSLVTQSKEKLLASKNQIMALTPDLQEDSCSAGLLALNNLKNEK